MTDIRHRITHVIFDMDGVLLDTESIYTNIYRSVIGEYGKVFDWSIKSRLMGRKAIESATIMVQELELPLAPQELLDKAELKLKEAFPKSDLMPGADKLVRHLHRHGVPIAVSTGSSKPIFDLKTQSKHKDFFELFHHIVCCGSDPAVKHGKPAPDAYLVAADRFDGGAPNPEDVLVIEDASMGVKSSLAAGMKTVFMPDANLDESFWPEGYHQRIKSLGELIPEEWGLPAYAYSPKAHPLLYFHHILKITDSHSMRSWARGPYRDIDGKVGTNTTQLPKMNSKKGYITHVIFDMDGVLLDTENIYSTIYSGIIANYGKTYTWALKAKLMGMKPIPAAQLVIDALDLPIEAEEFLQLAEEEQKEKFPFCNIKPGAERLVTHLHKHKIPIAVSTGSSQRLFNLKTQSKHKAFFELFHHIVCCGSDPEVKHGKPAPDAYTVAADRFDGGAPNPENVLVFEDAPNGVISGLGAGMKTVFLPNKNLDKTFYPEGFHQVLSSMEEFVPEEWSLPSFNS
ncbi:uncharacterized protein [Ptychodera flava]|uniref:uncharacterized protein n=1 Tax=Ptychodera flava TaxID=63121 RepID=UPI00396A2A15